MCGTSFHAEKGQKYCSYQISSSETSICCSALCFYTGFFFLFFLHGCRSKCRQPCKPSCQGFTSNVTFEWVLNRKRILVSLTLDKREAFSKQQSSRAWAGHFHTIIPEPELPLVRKDRHQKSQGLATGNVQGRGCSGGKQKFFSGPSDTHTCTFTAAFVASLAKLTTNGHADAW